MPTMSLWYYAREGRQLGPVEEDELRRLVMAGSVRGSDYVWTDGMADWQPADRVPGLIVAPPPGAGPAVAARAGDDDRPVPNYLPWAIAATLCCCPVGGILAIIYAVKANSAAARGEMAEARKAADAARLWLILAAVVSLVISLVQVVVVLFRAGSLNLLQ